MTETNVNNELGERTVDIPLSQLRHLVDMLKECTDETRVSMEFLLVGLFPTAWDNIMKYGSDCYMKGFMAAKEEEYKVMKVAGDADGDKGNN